LAWYDRDRRELPWRALPGIAPEPYRVWLSEIMLQQTRTETVARYYTYFLVRFPDVQRLARAKLSDVLKAWAGLGYYARARNLHACARTLMARHGGEFPASEEALRALPGIGAYTAAAIAAIAFGRKAAPVDGNVERVLARRYAVKTPLPAAKPELKRLAEILAPTHRAGDFAQAMMDLGATICTPKRPACSFCPWNDRCEANRRGEHEAFPRRVPKAEGALRRGAAFVVLRADGTILLRARPPRGLLGGMTEVPTTEWSADFDPRHALREAPQFSPLPGGERSARAAGWVRGKQSRKKSRAKTPPHPNPLPPGEREIRWRRLPGRVRHVFTHFPLELEVYAARVAKGIHAPKGARFVKLVALGGEALPSLMRKVVAHALSFEAKLDG
jgi:A/G-specific adenine glycosylase